MTNLSPMIVLLFCVAQTLSLPCHRNDKDRKVALTTCRVLQFPRIEVEVEVEDIDDNSRVLGYHVCGLKTLQDILHHLIRRGQMENYHDF